MLAEVILRVGDTPVVLTGWGAFLIIGVIWLLRKD